MKRFIFKRPSAFIIILIVFSNCKVALIDISPDRPNGEVNGGVSTAGLVLNMAGDKNALYAIGLNSGVWKTQLNANGIFDAWKQLPQSPRYADCIAVDPGLPNHIAVGEREGDGIFPAQSNSGLWESYDGGKTFDPKYYFNPLWHPCRQDNTTQVVNGVVITNSSTTIITTPCGIARKEYLSKEFKYADLGIAVDEGGFTAIAMFKDWIVARTSNLIFISNDDGKTWGQPIIIQYNFQNQSFAENSQGELYSICIVQEPETNNVFVYIPATRNPNSPCLGSDKGLDNCLGVESSTCNYSSFLVFNKSNNTWNYQIIRERGIGVGWGGRVFMKSFFSPYNYLKSIVSGNTNLIYCGAQNIFKAKKILSDGTAEWENIANANVCGEPKKSDIHGDMWDYLLDPSGEYSYVSCDGGVYDYGLTPKQSTIDLSTDNKYVNLNEGLHISHIHEAFVAGYLGNRPANEHYGYGAQDNGGWQSISVGNATNWKNIYGGDANFCRGDQGNPNFIVTGTHLEAAVLQTFDNPAPAGVPIGGIAISHDQNCKCRNYYSSFQFIQTMANEGPRFYLDAVMLATLPLTFTTDNKNFTTIPQFAGTSGLVIMRNTAFALTPDIDKLNNGNTGWNVEVNNLPTGVQGMYVAGGHNDPTYFLICNQSGNTLLFKRKKSESQWTPINLPDKVTINNYSPGADQHAPFFVNPYNASELYVSCADGVYHGSLQLGVGNSHGIFIYQYFFKKDEQLTILVTGNGKYPVNTDFPGGNGNNVVRSNQSNLNAMFPLSCISFNRYHPQQVVASSPYTGVFYKNGDNEWKDFSDILPKPFTPVSSVNINNQGIYVTTEGRGIFKIVNY
ncbi:MAG: hypothetical protein ABI472_25380 [Ginsengibacter sp.]